MADLPKDNKEATVIGNDTHIKGEMSFKKSVRLVGSLEWRVVG
jgi:cytoskeletal protein CcmA (bactofilin family)